MIRGLFAAAMMILMTSCIVKHLVGGPKLTGTCSGACAHYVECKPGQLEADRTRCEAECPGVFSDRDSLMAFESLSCKNAVEYVDGTQPKTANPSSKR
ncbi:MAG TPA: hypothetical protein VIV11_17900 [Kofleriaceae bacterium]